MGSRCAGQDVQAPDTCPEGIRVQQLRVVSVADAAPSETAVLELMELPAELQNDAWVEAA